MSQLNGHLPETERLLTPAEAAGRLGIRTETLTSWRLSSVRTLGGHRRYRESVIEDQRDAMTAAGGAS